MDDENRRVHAVVHRRLAARGRRLVDVAATPARERDAHGGDGDRSADHRAAAARAAAAARCNGSADALAAGRALVAAGAGAMAGDRRSGAAARRGDRKAARRHVPARDFKAIAPARPFVQGERRRRTIDPAGYRRYDGLVRQSRRSMPRTWPGLQDDPAPAERGLPQHGPSRRRRRSRLQQTLDILIDTPVVKDPIAVIEGDGAGWAYADANSKRSRRRKSNCYEWDRRTSIDPGLASRIARRTRLCPLGAAIRPIPKTYRPIQLKTQLKTSNLQL